MKFRLASGLSLIVACSLGLSACSSIKMPHVWPFYKKPKPVPVAVLELNLVNADGSAASFPQYWKRNTLVIDLSGAGGTGTFAARLPEETTWPVRLAVRVRPGSVGQVEIQGEERSVLPVSNEGTANIDLDVVPSVYTPKTAAIYISWGPIPAFAEAAPVEATPAFVSPTTVPAESTPSAGEIIAPAEAQPAQPSPPPGS
ncbi:MAG TPA: hypothetical protein VEW08_12440 [Steroidobacteraceae bacterium]|nr:hypothetical protein [Steroidobacteraceae bacterium]